MREKPTENEPFKVLGRQLKNMRQKLQESLGDTSGAVEINVESLERFERGAEVPSEDILLLLINHFNLQDDEAVKLWELAGYDADEQFGPDDECDNPDHWRGNEHIGPLPGAGMPAGGQQAKFPIMVLALDNRVLYSNGAEIVSDDSGLTINFRQQSPDPAQNAVTVSRVGMSYEQAQHLLETLQHSLLHHQYLGNRKQLPGSDAGSNQ